MRKLDRDRHDYVLEVVAQNYSSAINAALLEKDEHLTAALKVIFGLDVGPVQLVFCGGSSLSKGHGIIQRMSEDADIKVVLPDVTPPWSKNKIRTFLGRNVRDAVIAAMNEMGFQGVSQTSLNENRYVHTEWAYRYLFGSQGHALRPNLLIELTARAPLLPTTKCKVQTMADRLTGHNGVSFDVTTIALAETMAEKIVSFLRRLAQHRQGMMQRSWDTALVRHIHDVHCIHQSHPEALADARKIFPELVAGDIEEFGRQFPPLQQDPRGVLGEALSLAETDPQTIQEYNTNLLPLIYGAMRPTFVEAFASFKAVAQDLIGELA